MINMILAFLLHHWFLCCVASQIIVGVTFTYPINLAYWQRIFDDYYDERTASAIAKRDRRSDVAASLAWAAIIPWPVGIPVTLLRMHKYYGWKGFMWRPE